MHLSYLQARRSGREVWQTTVECVQRAEHQQEHHPHAQLHQSINHSHAHRRLSVLFCKQDTVILLVSSSGHMTT